MTWHLVHLGDRAVGGAGLVFTEATAVTADGRITAQDLGLWSDEQIEPLQRIHPLHRRSGAALLAFSWPMPGRKASTYRPLARQARQRQARRGRLGAGRTFTDRV